MNIQMQPSTNKEMLVFVAASKNTSTTGKRRRDILNKFLTKTFHMLSQCPENIAAWSHDGSSFTIKDVDAFEIEILPQYFNHSKFSSFVRQLCFYNFTKERSDPDLQAHTKAVRFSHPYFRQGEPDLLHNITRTTASKPADEVSSTNEQVERLQQQVTQLKEHVASLENNLDERVEDTLRSRERNYLLRIHNLERSYEALLLKLLSERNTIPSTMLTSSPQLSTATSLAELADYIGSKHQMKPSP